jgi:glycosyltransferase involved in cell wall biosynthesis
MDLSGWQGLLGVKIYIVTVCLNANEALRATIESINALRTKDVYYLVVDGNSNDGTKETLIGSSGLIDRWISEPDQGIYDAMNKAISLLPPEEGHVLFLGAGDKLVALPTPQECEPRAVLFGNVQIGDRTFVSSIGWKLKMGNTLHHQGLFVPRSVLTGEGFDVRFKIFADFDLNQRLCKRNIPFQALNKTIAFATPGGVTWRRPAFEMLDIARKNYGILWACAARLWSEYRRLRQHLLGRSW